MIVSLANSIRFVVQNGLDSSFNNTLFNDEQFGNYRDGYYCQKFVYKDAITIQIKATLTETVTLTRYNSDGSTATITPATTTTYSAFKILDYTITIATDDYFYLVASSDVNDSWKSEPVMEDSRGDLLKLQWYSYDPSLTFEFDYSNDEVNFLYVEGRIHDYAPAGEATVYDNQNEKIKVKQSLFRTLKFVSDPIPRYLAEKIQIALAHDKFLINGVQYVSEDMIEVSPFGGSTLVTISAVLTESNVLGLNTDDLGFDCDNVNTDDMIINLVKENASGQFSFTLTAGYSINQIILVYEDGTNSKFKAGWTVGGEEILHEYTVSGSYPIVMDRELARSADTDKTIYCEVSGTNALVDVYIQTIKFIES